MQVPVVKFDLVKSDAIALGPVVHLSDGVGTLFDHSCDAFTPPKACTISEVPYPRSVTSKRAEDARLRIELEERARRQEAAQAQRLIDDFLAAARAKGMTPEPLRAQLMDGHEARTDRRGWYLNAKHSLAIGEHGEYYQLVVPGGFMERMRGVKLEPSSPPMHIGRGGRDRRSQGVSGLAAGRLSCSGGREAVAAATPPELRSPFDGGWCLSV